LQRKREKINTKKAFKSALSELITLKEVSKTERSDRIERIINSGFEKYLAQKSYKKDDTDIKKKKQKYAKSFATSSVLYVSEFGTFLGVSKNLITIKKKGKIIAKMPKRQCEQIIIAGKAISLSSNMVRLCSKEKIAIDYVDGTGTPYASLLSHKTSYAKTALKQLEIILNRQEMILAKKFIKGKAKNQLNYLKYLDKYHKELQESIDKMEKKIKINLAQAKDISQLMGYEGEISTLYWQSLAGIVKDKCDFTNRVTQGATDLVNASLNYGYAILYTRIQNAALHAGLALHISFLHSMQEEKPTLIYDMIEEFRAFVVDRTIFSMINKNEPLRLNSDGYLSKKSTQLIVKNIKERLGSYTRHKKASKKIETIIQDQAYLLARHIKGEDTYKPFIGKY
jgi:CRISPR-associated endonuclease Cas1